MTLLQGAPHETVDALHIFACSDGRVGVCFGQAALDGAGRAKAVEPFVEEGTLVVVHIDLSRIALQRAFDFLGKVVPNAPVDIRATAKQLEAFVRPGVKEFYLVGLQPQMLGIVPVPPGMDENALREASDPDGMGEMVTVRWCSRGRV